MDANRPPLKFKYRNYRGEIGIRTATPIRVEYRHSDWHPSPQWLLVAFDHEKQGERDFAMIDILEVYPPTSLT